VSELCQFRTERECLCPADTCEQRTATPAPVILISIRTQMAVCLFVGVIAAFLAAALMEPGLKRADLRNQEVVNVAR
jgi:hypothetical protein